jgi:hypothetical protein
VVVVYAFRLGDARVRYFDNVLEIVYEKENLSGRLSTSLVHPGVDIRNFVTNANPVVGTAIKYPPVGSLFAFNVISLNVASLGLPTGYAVSLKE